MSQSDQKVDDTNDDDDQLPIVIDIGSYSTFAGFTGNDSPTVDVPSAVGVLKNKDYQLGHSNIMHKKDIFVGNDAMTKRGILSIRYPIERGIVTNWDDMEKIWHTIFYNELSVAPEEHAVLITETALNPKFQREKSTQIMFENFNVPRFYVTMSSLCSLYASGRSTGIVLESGYNLTSVVPVYEGYPLPHAILQSRIGGLDITQHLIKKLKINNPKFASIYGCSSVPSSSERDIVRQIKEDKCYVALSYEEELQKIQISLEENYKLPDKQVISISTLRYECGEILFNPYLCGTTYEQTGIQTLLSNAIKKCDPDIRRDYYRNIILAGGNTMFKGIGERLQKELYKSVHDHYDVKVVSPPERKYSAWIGGSILSGLCTFDEYWITKAEYDETGPSIVHRKCT